GGRGREEAAAAAGRERGGGGREKAALADALAHAKSAWRSDGPADHARPPNKRGRRDAPRVGKRLAQQGWVPEHVVASDSRRTRETWERMQKHFPEARVSFTQALYGGGPTELRTEVARLPASERTV